MVDLDVVVVGAGFAGIYAVRAFRSAGPTVRAYEAQPEVLRYLNRVADRFGLWPDIQLSTRVTAAVWDAERSQRSVTTDDGRRRTARFVLTA